MKLYHGISSIFLPQIIEKGYLEPSKNGLFGAGVYLTSSKTKAIAWAKYVTNREKKRNDKYKFGLPVVVEVEANLGNMKTFDMHQVKDSDFRYVLDCPPRDEKDFDFIRGPTVCLSPPKGAYGEGVMSVGPYGWFCKKGMKEEMKSWIEEGFDCQYVPNPCPRGKNTIDLWPGCEDGMDGDDYVVKEGRCVKYVGYEDVSLTASFKITKMKLYYGTCSVYLRDIIKEGPFTSLQWTSHHPSDVRRELFGSGVYLTSSKAKAWALADTWTREMNRDSGYGAVPIVVEVEATFVNMKTFHMREEYYNDRSCSDELTKWRVEGFDCQYVPNMCRTVMKVTGPYTDSEERIYGDEYVVIGGNNVKYVCHEEMEKASFCAAQIAQYEMELQDAENVPLPGYDDEVQVINAQLALYEMELQEAQNVLSSIEEQRKALQDDGGLWKMRRENYNFFGGP